MSSWRAWGGGGAARSRAGWFSLMRTLPAALLVHGHLVSCSLGSLGEDMPLRDLEVGFIRFLEAQEVEWWHQPKFLEIQAPNSRPTPEASQGCRCQEMTHISFCGNMFDVLRVP